MPPNYYSASQFDTYQRCGLQWYYRYVEGLKRAPGFALVLGSATHEGAHFTLDTKRTTGRLPESDEVQDVAVQGVRGMVAKDGLFLADEERAMGVARVTNDLENKARSLSVLHLRKVAPQIRPKHLERKFSMKLEGLPDVIGYIDVQEEDGKLGDLKTKSRTMPEAEVHRSDQLTIYHIAAQAVDQSTPTGIYVDQLVSTETPKHVRVETTRSSLDHERVTMRMRRIHDAITKGVFQPAPEDSWVCCSKWCGYYDDTCPFGRRNRTRP